MQSEVSGVRQLDMFADAAQEEHLCLDCGVDISHLRRDAQRCKPCSKVRDRQRANNHYWANRSEKLQYIDIVSGPIGWCRALVYNSSPE